MQNGLTHEKIDRLIDIKKGEPVLYIYSSETCFVRSCQKINRSQKEREKGAHTMRSVRYITYRGSGDPGGSGGRECVRSTHTQTTAEHTTTEETNHTNTERATALRRLIRTEEDRWGVNCEFHFNLMMNEVHVTCNSLLLTYE